MSVAIGLKPPLPLHAKADGILKEFRLSPDEARLLGSASTAWITCNCFDYYPLPENKDLRRSDIRRLLIVDSYINEDAIYQQSNTKPAASLVWRLDENRNASCTMGIPRNAAFEDRKEDALFNSARKAFSHEEIGFLLAPQLQAKLSAASAPAYNSEHNPFARALIAASIFALSQAGVRDLRFSVATRDEASAWTPWVQDLGLSEGNPKDANLEALLKSVITKQVKEARFDGMFSTLNPFT